MADAGLVQALSRQVSGVTEEQIKSVLLAWDVIRNGSPVGTIMFNPADKAVAYRVSEDGFPLWSVAQLDGTTYRDLSPTLVGWEILRNGD